MASGSSNINYFPENQLTTCSIHFEYSENMVWSLALQPIPRVGL